MKWYGTDKKNNIKGIRNYKLRINLKIRSLNFFLKSKINYSHYKVYFYLPENWSFIIIKPLNTQSNNLLYYIYSPAYYFYLSTPSNFVIFNYDKPLNVLNFNFMYRNNFYNIYWTIFKNIFDSFNQVFFKKLKFKGKGYYIFKNYRNTIAMQFGYSHILRIYSYFISVKFITKTSILLFGINKADVLKTSFNLFNTKPINIFTGKGIRFTRQIIYKKTGKVSSYR